MTAPAPMMMFVLDAFVDVVHPLKVNGGKGTGFKRSQNPRISSPDDEAPIPTGRKPPSGVYRGTIIGRSPEGERITRVVSSWVPYIYVRMPSTWSNDLSRRFARNVKGVIQMMSHAKGFDLDLASFARTGEHKRRKFMYMKLKFRHSREMETSKYKFSTGDYGSRDGGPRQDMQLKRWLMKCMPYAGVGSYDERVSESESAVESALSDPYAFTTANKVIGSGGIGLEQSLLNFIGIAPGEWLDLTTMRRASEQPAPPTLLVSSFDIETNSGKAGDPYPRPFSVAHKAHNAAFQISVVNSEYKNGRCTITDTVVLCLGDTSPSKELPVNTMTVKGVVYHIPKPVIRTFASESELLTEFAVLMSRVDFCMGYNVRLTLPCVRAPIHDRAIRCLDSTCRTCSIAPT